MAEKDESIDIGRASSATCPDTSRRNPVKAIRLKCLDCSGGSTAEVEKCAIPECALYPFRFGRNPFRAERVLTAAHLAALAEGKKRLNALRVGSGSEKQVSLLPLNMEK